MRHGAVLLCADRWSFAFYIRFFASDVRAHPEVAAACFDFAHRAVWKCAALLDEAHVLSPLCYWGATALCLPESAVVAAAAVMLKAVLRHLAQEWPPQGLAGLPPSLEAHGALLVDTCLRGLYG